MNKPELEVYIGDFAPIFNLEKTALMLRSQLVDHTPHGPQLSGKYIHLTMSTELAMQLLAVLQEAQKTLGLARHLDQVEVIAVPPAKDRS